MRLTGKRSWRVAGFAVFVFLVFFEAKHLLGRRKVTSSDRRGIPSKAMGFITHAQRENPNSLVTKTVDNKKAAAVVNGFLSLPERKPLRLSCTDCAFVTSSGQLLKSGMGKHIDKHSCIIRSNDSPITSFEEDVGSRTTIRMLSAFSMPILEKLVKRSPLFDRTVSSESTIIISGSTQGEAKAKMLLSIREQCPNIQIYNMTSNYSDHVIIEYRRNIVHKAGEHKHSGQSNGFVSMLFAHEVCDVVHVYGMTDPEHCQRKLANNVTDETPYHYYGNYGSECAYFSRTNSGHDYIAEKELFRAWRDTKKKLSFHAPEWPA